MVVVGIVDAVFGRAGESPEAVAARAVVEGPFGHDLAAGVDLERRAFGAEGAARGGRCWRQELAGAEGRQNGLAGTVRSCHARLCHPLVVGEAHTGNIGSKRDTGNGPHWREIVHLSRAECGARPVIQAMAQRRAYQFEEESMRG